MSHSATLAGCVALSRRAVLVGGLALAVLSTPALLIPPSVLPVPSSARAQDAGPAAPVAVLNDGLTAIMKSSNRTPFMARYDKLAPVVDHTFDLPAILIACVGPRWETLPETDRATLFEVFRRFTIASYVANFDEANGERFVIEPATRSVGADQVVQTSIVGMNGAATRIDYLMHQGPKGWRAIDVLLDGSISRVAVQRSDFRALVGTDASGLIASLRRKIADLSGGAFAS